MPRFFAEIHRFPLAVIEGRDSIRHISGPLRKRQGDELAIRIGSQGYRARISSLTPRKIELEIMGEETLRDRSPAAVHLAMCLIDLKDMDDTVRSATELGVSQIQPLICARSNIRDVTQARLARWRSIILEAVKQCDRRSIPEIREPMPLQAYAATSPPPAATRLVAHREAERSLVEFRGGDCIILIGPEGGLSEDEMRLLTQSGFIPVGLGGTTLRAATAAVSALSILGC